MFAWDAEDRLVGITWPAQPGRQVTFAYDGQGRRTSISSTPAGGGGTTTTSYVWCGSSLCQVRNASNAVTRAYYGEGEFVPGAPAQRLYYGADQIGSVRRVFASTGSAPAYAYDPYGVALQGTAPLTDFGFAGMFWHADSGLYLTQYRAYDPVLGRWLSRDPVGEGSDPQANLYAYVGSNPVTITDPQGGFWPILAGAAALLAYALTPHVANAPAPGECTVAPDPWAPLRNAGIAGGTVLGAQVGVGLWAARAGGGAAGGASGTTAVPAAIDANKLHHIFGQARHKLGPLVQQFGSQEAAFAAVQNATQAAVKSQGLSGLFRTTVNVGGQNVVVKGNVMDGVARIGTFYIR